MLCRRSVLAITVVSGVCSPEQHFTWCESSPSTSLSKTSPNLRPQYRIVVCGEGEAANAASSELQRIVRQSPATPYDIQITQVPSGDLATDAPAIDLNDKLLRLRSGKSLPYEQCILAFDRPLAPLLDKIVSPELLSSRQQSYAVIRDSRNPEDLEFAAQIVRHGGHVTLLGANNWANVDAACYLASIAAQHRYKRSVTLVYPSYGPMAGLLPRFMSLQLAARLVSRGVELVPFSQVRYIDGYVPPSPAAAAAAATATAASTKARKPTSDPSKSTAATVYLARTYDTIHSTSFPTDVVMLGPSMVTAEWRDTLPELRVVPSQQGLIQALLHTQDLEIDRLLGGIPVNRSLQVAQGVLVAGECANVYHAIAPPPQTTVTSANNIDNNNFAGLSYRRIIAGGYDARHAGRMAASIALGQQRVYAKVPCDVFASSHVGMSFFTVGLCTPAVESHSFWWRIPVVSPRASYPRGPQQGAGGAGVEKKPVFSEYLRRDFRKAMVGGAGSGDHSTKEDASIAVTTAAASTAAAMANGPRGKYAVHQPATTATSATNATTAKRSSSGTINGAPADPILTEWSSRQFPLGLGVTVFVDQYRIVGILCAGLPLGQLQDTSAPATDRWNDADVAVVEQVLAKYLGRSVLTPEQQHTLSEGQDFDRFGWNRHMEQLAEEMLREVGQRMDRLQAPPRPQLPQLQQQEQETSSSLETFSSFIQHPNVRKQYRWGPASRTTVMEMSEHVTRQLANRAPASMTEPLYLLKANTGSRADRLVAAYAKHIVHAANAANPQEALQGPNHKNR
eukprot:gene7580-5447_t